MYTLCIIIRLSLFNKFVIESIKKHLKLTKIMLKFYDTQL
jgi:hypothetical protein